jgi:hypothetical protein
MLDLEVLLVLDPMVVAAAVLVKLQQDRHPILLMEQVDLLAQVLTHRVVDIVPVVVGLAADLQEAAQH